MRIRRRNLLQAGAMVVTGAALTRRGFGQDQEGDRAALEKNLDTVLQDAVERGDVPGVIGASPTVTRRSMAARSANAGLRLGRADKTFDTVTYLASMTKPITATAAMQLIEQGKLELDAPISKWVPRAADLQVLDGWDDKGEPVLRPPTREVTLRHLMTHTSGFAYDLWDADLARYMKQKGVPPLNSARRRRSTRR